MKLTPVSVSLLTALFFIFTTITALPTDNSASGLSKRKNSPAKPNQICLCDKENCGAQGTGCKAVNSNECIKQKGSHSEIHVLKDGAGSDTVVFYPDEQCTSTDIFRVTPDAADLYKTRNLQAEFNSYMVYTNNAAPLPPQDTSKANTLCVYGIQRCQGRVLTGSCQGVDTDVCVDIPAPAGAWSYQIAKLQDSAAVVFFDKSGCQGPVLTTSINMNVLRYNKDVITQKTCQSFFFKYASFKVVKAEEVVS